MQVQTPERLALAELASLKRTLAWRPVLPARLPAGFSYFRIDSTDANRYGFSAEILDATNSGLRLMERPYETPTAGSKPDPLIAFRGQLVKVTLANGPWMAQQLQGGGWIFMRDWGSLRIYIDGNVPRATLESFAATLR